MSIHPDFPKTTTSGPRGGAPVGMLRELPALEATAILFLRAWCQGGLARNQIAQDLAGVLSAADAQTAVADFDALMSLVLSGARRNLMRHDLRCGCFGGDESAFAQMIAASASADSDDAMLFAATLLAGPAAFEAVHLARCLAQPFLRLARLSPYKTSPVASAQVH